MHISYKILGKFSSCALVYSPLKWNNNNTHLIGMFWELSKLTHTMQCLEQCLAHSYCSIHVSECYFYGSPLPWWAGWSFLKWVRHDWLWSWSWEAGRQWPYLFTNRCKIGFTLVVGDLRISFSWVELHFISSLTIRPPSYKLNPRCSLRAHPHQKSFPGK